MIGLKLKVNKPPQGGSCLVIPPEDVSLSDITRCHIRLTK